MNTDVKFHVSFTFVAPSLRQCLAHIRPYECMCAKSLQSCPTLQSHGLYPPGSSVHGILQAGIPECVAIPSSRGSPTPGMGPTSSVSPTSAGEFFTAEPPGKPHIYMYIHICQKISGSHVLRKVTWNLKTALPQWAIFLMIISHKSLFLLSFNYKIKN